MKQYVVTVVSQGQAHDDEDLTVLNHDLTTAGTGFFGKVTQLDPVTLSNLKATEWLAAFGYDPAVLLIPTRVSKERPVIGFDPDHSLFAQCGIDLNEYSIEDETRG